MSYFSAEEPMLGNPLGCGPECNCGPCRSGMNGFNEWYEKDEDDEPPFEVMTPGAPQNNIQPPLSGWYGRGLGFYSLGEETPAPAPGTVPTPEPAQTAPDQGPGSQPEPAHQQEPSPPPPSREGAPTESKPQTADQNRLEADLRLIRESLSRGIRNLKRLTDIVFFDRHPNLKDSSAWSSDSALFDEWRQIREEIVLPEFRRSVRSRPRIVYRYRPRPVRRRGLHGYPGLGYFAAPPVCDAARRDLEAVGDDLKLIQRELARGAGASPTRLNLKRQLLDLEVDGMIRSLDAYIATGCCEPSLQVLESEIHGLGWPPLTIPTKTRLVGEIVAARARARKDFKHC